MLFLRKLTRMRISLSAVAKLVGMRKIEDGCGGEGRVQGGIATVPGFGWWPIKAYRPCPAFLATGGRYQRTTNDDTQCGVRAAPTMEEGEARAIEMDEDLKKRIRKTVRKILKRSSLYEMTEIKAREQASSELNLDLYEEPYKHVVREAVESFIEEAIATIENHKGKSQNLTQEEEEEEGADKTKMKKKKKKKTTTTTKEESDS